MRRRPGRFPRGNAGAAGIAGGSAVRSACRSIPRRFRPCVTPPRRSDRQLRSRGCFLTLTVMALMLSKTYDAFRVAGAPDDKAREAAEEIAGFEVRLSGIESDVKLLKWMAGFNVALSMAILAILLRLLAV